MVTTDPYFTWSEAISLCSSEFTVPLQEAHCLSYAWSYHKHALQYANKTGIDEKKTNGIPQDFL